MPKITEKKIGLVFIREIKPGKWRGSWMDPSTKRWVRRLLPASCLREAEAQAKEINGTLAQGKGFSPRVRGGSGMTVRDAIQEAINHSDANDRTRADYVSRGNAFMKHLRENVAGVKGWADVSEPVIEDFIQATRKAGSSHDTLRLRMFVLRMTAVYMARVYPGEHRNAVAGIKLKRLDPPKAQLEAKEAILSPVQLRSLLTWLRRNRPMVYTWAALQGLAGLRLYEAAYLREQDFDPIARTVRVTDTSAHKPKNRHSYRTIPVCQTVADALTTWIDGLKVRHNEGYLFMPSKAIKGRRDAKSIEARAGAFARSTVDHFATEAIEAALAAKIEAKKPDAPQTPENTEAAAIDIPAAFTPRRLRASFVTAAREVGADLALLQAVIGHAPLTILSAHYDKIDLPRLASVAAIAEELARGIGRFAAPQIDTIKTEGLQH